MVSDFVRIVYRASSQPISSVSGKKGPNSFLVLAPKKGPNSLTRKEGNKMHIHKRAMDWGGRMEKTISQCHNRPIPNPKKGE